MYKYIAFFIVCVFMVAPSHSGQVKSNTTIDNVRVKMDVAYVKFSDCSYYSRIYLNSEYEKLMYSSALVAATAGRRVSVEFDGPDCSASELELVYIDVSFR